MISLNDLVEMNEEYGFEFNIRSDKNGDARIELHILGIGRFEINRVLTEEGLYWEYDTEPFSGFESVGFLVEVRMRLRELLSEDPYRNFPYKTLKFITKHNMCETEFLTVVKRIVV